MNIHKICYMVGNIFLIRSKKDFIIVVFERYMKNLNRTSINSPFIL
ncbi:hypothetical protein LEP1GSC116_4545 [Leptospira interrogans serovar Icterohaemorrhagiae str. Verdun HP]|uniref:Uncharacterized protein n=1 Tax=Leptospira interrogans serovar Icterohaemorrhagiae str. Verdun HP TaxID=1049910 RepID=M6REG0_LEPIR|nr:hypothetical protein LEP1GSC116_4545 [Leptospira interrogans serovar Icterohaemorrhagiae str. Verdun HP]